MIILCENYESRIPTLLKASPAESGSSGVHRRVHREDHKQHHEGGDGGRKGERLPVPLDDEGRLVRQEGLRGHLSGGRLRGTLRPDARRHSRAGGLRLGGGRLRGLRMAAGGGGGGGGGGGRGRRRQQGWNGAHSARALTHFFGGPGRRGGGGGSDLRRWWLQKRPVDVEGRDGPAHGVLVGLARQQHHLVDGACRALVALLLVRVPEAEPLGTRCGRRPRHHHRQAQKCHQRHDLSANSEHKCKCYIYRTNKKCFFYVKVYNLVVKCVY